MNTKVCCNWNFHHDIQNWKFLIFCLENSLHSIEKFFFSNCARMKKSVKEKKSRLLSCHCLCRHCNCFNALNIVVGRSRRCGCRTARWLWQLLLLFLSSSSTTVTAHNQSSTSTMSENVEKAFAAQRQRHFNWIILTELHNFHHRKHTNIYTLTTTSNNRHETYRKI